ncbi:hypothetical protein [Corynebacterium endometrii]|uniref:Uncharacterized protein n=1 Tax=Corynebacterium endometrii TaxID=2488819 RepID=A0A4P7QH96_9CORY|nr:hypothetical protein [Corynebacterium endometrii]QCB28880.1 hypothetical protein CENDO_08030 [Corynebacterium endometrii]
MGQENFAGPEYFTEFDPEKFIRDLKQMAEMDSECADSSAPASESPKESAR